ncbi:endonuclease/exonuclease/phosphatase family protein [Sinomicrobium soli]|uniref:endonuclease/exonuclease/phosphatase family protein n=1 Tax=Sinomicrobium sp. N-1-3-6 TaxID=2219864 RepID=UPI000DCC7A3D|nr:endonuclease/exonuclease/phosphatase family protein [Sinomicrobium sp. N-1-3-6]RAV28422.1 hypothetical protein DN748_13645 [Sinomicrobium sp. N-1-3-6]
MNRFIILTILFFLEIVSCHGTHEEIKDPGWEDTADPDTITVMSYNIKYGSPLGSSISDLEAIAGVIEEAKPDVVFLQEVDKNTTRSGNADQLKLLSERTGLSSYFYGRAIDYQGGQTGIGILSRYPLSDPELFKLPRVELGEQYVSYRVLVTADIRVKGKDITIANTHLALTAENREIQVPEIHRILSDSDNPVIFGGDLNARPDSETITSFMEYGYRKTCKTDCFTIPSVEPNRELDYIMFRPENSFEVLSHQVIGNLSSDHLPVVSVLQIK